MQRSVVPSADVLFQELGDEGVALHLGRGKYYGFDDVATRMWMLLSSGRARDQVIETLLAEYAVERLQLEHDLDGFIAQLMREGLLQASDESKGAAGDVRPATGH